MVPDGTLPPKPVVISFDDGYRPQFTFALPELRRHGWAGVLNLKAEGSDLYPSNVEAMIAAGWELASHTISHPDLTTVDGATTQLRGFADRERPYELKRLEILGSDGLAGLASALPAG